MTNPKSPLVDRYGQEAGHLQDGTGYSQLLPILSRGSCRSFKTDEVDANLVQLLCAAALASPTKSDLQQRDIIVIRNPGLKSEIAELMSEQSWIAEIPCLLVFCGNNRRQRRLHQLRNRPFENDHLDAFFNAAVDAGVALSAFVLAAEAVGLGCCPISAIRNDADRVSDLLGLPQHVFPVAGLALGYPASNRPTVSPRLPLDVTVHTDRYNEDGIDDQIDRYDARRNGLLPYKNQRGENRFGTSDSYGWSEDKARQYAQQERQGFGTFIRDKGFDLS